MKHLLKAKILHKASWLILILYTVKKCKLKNCQHAISRQSELRNERNIQENEDKSSTLVPEIFATPDNSDYGYIVETDLKYTQLMHESHQDYPLAPTKEVVQKDWLSSYQTSLSEQMKNNEN